MNHPVFLLALQESNMLHRLVISDLFPGDPWLDSFSASFCAPSLWGKSDWFGLILICYQYAIFHHLSQSHVSFPNAEHIAVFIKEVFKLLYLSELSTLLLSLLKQCLSMSKDLLTNGADHLVLFGTWMAFLVAFGSLTGPVSPILASSTAV